MSDELLPYYHRELAFIRRLGGEFAEAHPKIAGRLRLSPDAAEDPHVERLIEAFAALKPGERVLLTRRAGRPAARYRDHTVLLDGPNGFHSLRRQARGGERI